MTRPETAQEIDDVAALWAVRVDSGDLGPSQEEELDAWLAGDQRRVGAFARARAVAISLDKAKALRGTTGLHAPPRISRRTATAALAGMAASVAGGFLVWREFSGVRTFDTRLGEVAVHAMEDGSVVTLNTASRINVDFSRSAREMTLVGGEAIFDVAHDASRPFTVRAGDILVRAVGTSFLVRNLDSGPPEVVVREGKVDVFLGADEGRSLRLGERQRIVAGPAAKVESLAADKLARELAWVDGQLAFEGDTLGEAAAAFARYSEIRFKFEDPGIAEERVTGLFVSTDPVGFARAIASAFNLEARTDGGEVSLRRR